MDGGSGVYAAEPRSMPDVEGMARDLHQSGLLQLMTLCGYALVCRILSNTPRAWPARPRRQTVDPHTLKFRRNSRHILFL